MCVLLHLLLVTKVYRFILWSDCSVGEKKMWTRRHDSLSRTQVPDALLVVVRLRRMDVVKFLVEDFDFCFDIDGTSGGLGKCDVPPCALRFV
jgi:hypothetical protein